MSVICVRGRADDPYDGATGFPIELKTIRYVLSHNGVTESLQGGSDIKKKLKAMLKLAGPEGDFILAHIVQGDVARGEDPGPHPTKARPAAPDTPVEYIRLLSARTAKKSSTTITKNSLEKWKHTVVPTKNCMHLEVIRRLLIKHADKVGKQTDLKRIRSHYSDNIM